MYWETERNDGLAGVYFSRKHPTRCGVFHLAQTWKSHPCQIGVRCEAKYEGRKNSDPGRGRPSSVPRFYFPIKLDFRSVPRSKVVLNQHGHKSSIEACRRTAQIATQFQGAMRNLSDRSPPVCCGLTMIIAAVPRLFGLSIPLCPASGRSCKSRFGHFFSNVGHYFLVVLVFMYFWFLKFHALYHRSPSKQLLC
jgi:hypothetical protein